MKLYLNTLDQTLALASLDLKYAHIPEKSVFVFDFDDEESLTQTLNQLAEKQTPLTSQTYLLLLPGYAPGITELSIIHLVLRLCAWL